MNKIIITIIIIAIIAVGAVIVFSSNKKIDNINRPKELGLGPKIKVSPKLYDFGTVVFGDAPEHNFTITNIGSQPLKILRLATSCGCTEASMAEKDKIIAPGASAPLKVTFDPAVMKDNPDLGKVIRIVYVKTNDLSNPEVEVTINAFVIKNKGGN